MLKWKEILYGGREFQSSLSKNNDLILWGPYKIKESYLNLKIKKK